MMLLSSSGSSTRAAATATRSTAGRSAVLGAAVDGVAVRRPTPIRRQIARATGDNDDDGAEYEFSGGGPDPMEAAGEFRCGPGRKGEREIAREKN